MQPKPRFKQLKTIVIILLASLIYAVYFTEAGGPESSKSEKNISTYGQTAVPTIFVQWSPVPIIEIDWIDANRNLLKFTIIIHNLETNMNPEEWICGPRLKIEKPVSHRLTRYDMDPVYYASGESVRATYEYEISASDYVALAVNMEIIIGPCAGYLNFKDTSVTPFIRPELVGNYHLNFQVPVKLSTPSAPLTPSLMLKDTWRGLLIFPGGIETHDLSDGYPVYHYIVASTDLDTVRHFYEDQLLDAGWQLLGIGETSVANEGEGSSLWFARDKELITIDIFMQEDRTHVLIQLGE
jgi:hypothetical protein